MAINVDQDFPYEDFAFEANVLLYIDNSNMFESTKKYSGHKKGFIHQTPDYMCRLDVGRLMSKVLSGRTTVIPPKLYGSGTPKSDTGK